MNRPISFLQFLFVADEFSVTGLFTWNVANQMPLAKLLLRKPQHRDNVISGFPKALSSLESAKKINSFKLLDSWDIIDESNFRTLAEQASLFRIRKERIKAFNSKG